MNSNILPHVWRFFVLTLFQVLVLKQLALSAGSYFNVLIYPLFIFFLPIRIATAYAVLLGFAIGITVDSFYGSLGVHASAGAFSGLIRGVILEAFGPKGGLKGKEPVFAPQYFGWQSFLQAMGVFMVFHLFFYFSVDAFTFVYFTTITLKTLASWVLSMIFVLLFMAFFKVRE
jgi:hypothetical protein